MRLVNVTITEDDVVNPFIHTTLGLVAEVVESLAQSLFSLFHVEENRKFLCLEAFITDVTKYV